MEAPAKVYSECLFERNKDLGLPIWHPQFDPEDGEVQLADVGLVADGSFIKLFNCCATPDPTGCTTPSTHVAFRNPREFKLRSWFDRQAEYRSSSVCIVDISADIDLVQGGLGIGFKCTSKRGAALVVSQEGLQRRRMLAKKFVQDYVNTHYTSWQRFAASKGLPSEEIFFVGGFAKAKEWFVVAFTERNVDGGVLLHTPGNAGLVSVGLWGSCRQTCSPRWNYGPGGGLPLVRDAQGDIEMASVDEVQRVDSAPSLGCSGRPFTQCAFIERYTRKGRWSPVIRPRGQKAIKTNNNPQTSPRLDRVPQADSPNNSGDRTLPEGAEGGNGPGTTESLEDSESDMSQDSESLSSSDSAENISYDPLDTLLEYMLEACPESKFAAAGDHDIAIVMPEGIDDVYQFREQLLELKPPLMINQDGVVALDLKDHLDVPASDIQVLSDSDALSESILSDDIALDTPHQKLGKQIHPGGAVSTSPSPLKLKAPIERHTPSPAPRPWSPPNSPMQSPLLAAGSSQRSLESTFDDFRECGRLRLLVVGKAGVGKSSLIRQTFKVASLEASHGERGISDIRKEYTFDQNARFVVHDSQGYEPGETDNYDTLKNFIRQRSQRPRLADKLHVIWLCIAIPIAGGWVFETGTEELLRLAHKSVPVIIVFTKYDEIVVVKKMGLHEKNPKIGDEELECQSRAEADKDIESMCVEPLSKLRSRLGCGPMPYVKVSVSPSYEPLLSLLVEVTKKHVTESVSNLSGARSPNWRIRLGKYLDAKGGDRNLKFEFKSSGPTVWTCTIYINGVSHGEGIAWTKMGAREVASKQVLRSLSPSAVPES